MRAVCIAAPGGPEQLVIRQLDDPLPGPGQLRVRVHYAGINRADLLQRRGLYPAPPGYDSRVPGLEYAGLVDAHGVGAHRFAIGVPVMGLIPGGAYAEFVVVDEREAMPVPTDMSLRDAGAIPETWLTAWDAVWLQGSLQPGGWCLVRAATSAVGIACSQIGKALGCHVIGTTRSADRAARIADVGLDAVIVDGETELVASVMALTGGRGVDVVLDLVGGTRLQENLGSLASGGTLMVVGVLAGAQQHIDLGILLRRRLRMQGTVMRTRSSAERIRLVERATSDLLPLFAGGRLRPIVDSEFPLADAAAAHTRIEANQQLGKVLLRCI